MEKVVFFIPRTRVVNVNIFSEFHTINCVDRPSNFEENL